MRWLKALARIVVLTGIGSYLGVGVLLWAIQDRLIYPAPGGISRSALDAAAREVGARTVDLRAADETRLYAWHLQSTGRRLVLFLHGNGEMLPNYIPLFRVLNHNGWDVLALAYRGYPGSEGRPTEAGLALDAQAAWDWATGPAGYAPETIVVHGRSLGGGVGATLVAGDANPRALILESTFGSLRALASRIAPIYPVRWLLRSPFETRSRAHQLGVPVLLMHSRDDAVIPIEYGGRALRNVIAEVQYEETSGLTHQHCLPVSDPHLKHAYLTFLDRMVTP